MNSARGLAIAAAGLALALGALSPAAASAAKSPTQTTLTSSAAAVAQDGSVLLTATISPELKQIETSMVVFTDTTTGVRLGSVQPPPSCLQPPAAPCSVTLKVLATQLASGVNLITAHFTGNASQAPSSGSTSVIRTATGDGPTAKTCRTGSDGCFTGEVHSADGTASANVRTFGNPMGPVTLTIAFQRTPLTCSTPGSGDPVIFDAQGADGTKRVVYTVYGEAAAAAYDAASSGPHVCFVSPDPFATRDSSPAPQGPDGQYYGLLPSCGDAPVAPCVGSSYARFEGSEGPIVSFTDVLHVPGSDPRASN